jgi:hypothetical protein
MRQPTCRIELVKETECDLHGQPVQPSSLLPPTHDDHPVRMRTQSSVAPTELDVPKILMCSAAGGHMPPPIQPMHHARAAGAGAPDANRRRATAASVVRLPPQAPPRAQSIETNRPTGAIRSASACATDSRLPPTTERASLRAGRRTRGGTSVVPTAGPDARAVSLRRDAWDASGSSWTIRLRFESGSRHTKEPVRSGLLALLVRGGTNRVPLRRVGGAAWPGR